MDTAEPEKDEEGEVQKATEPSEKADSAQREDTDKAMEGETHEEKIAEDGANGTIDPSDPFPTGKMTGRVKSYNTRKGFGFLESHQLPNRDIFVYNTHLVGRIGLIAGEPVDFVLFWDGTRPQARHVKATSQPSVMPAAAIQGQTFTPSGVPHAAPYQAPQATNPVSGMENPLQAMKQAMAQEMKNVPNAPTQRDIVLAMAANAAEIPTTLPARKRPGATAQTAPSSEQSPQDMVAQKIREAQNTAQSERRQNDGSAMSMHAPEFWPGQMMGPPDIGKMAAGRIPKGTSIEVTNFPAMEMNGCRGVVLGYDGASARYHVEVEVRKANSGQVEKVPLQLKEDWLQIQGKIPQPKMPMVSSVPMPNQGLGGGSVAQSAAQRALARFTQQDAPGDGAPKATADAPRNMDATVKAALAAQAALLGQSKAGPPPGQHMPGMPPQPPMPSVASKAPEATAPAQPKAPSDLGYPQPPMPSQSQMRPPPPMPSQQGMPPPPMPTQQGMPPQPSMISKQMPPAPMGVTKAPAAEQPKAATQPPPAKVAKPSAVTPSVPEQPKATSAQKDSLPGWAGARWRVLRTREFADVIVREACEVTSKELRRINPDEVCTQKDSCVRLPNGVMRMPIHPSGWATVNAKEIGGPVFLELVKDQPGPQVKAFAKTPAPAKSSTSKMLPPDTGGPSYSRGTMLSLRLNFIGEKVEGMQYLRTLKIPGMAGPEKRERRRDREEREGRGDRGDKGERGDEDRPRRRDLARAAKEEKQEADQLQEWDPWAPAAEKGRTSPPKSRNHETPKRQREPQAQGEKKEKQVEGGEKGEKQGQCPTQ